MTNLRGGLTDISAKKRTTDLNTAMAHPKRAENLASIANDTADHLAMISYQWSMNTTATTPAATIADIPPVLPF